MDYFMFYIRWDKFMNRPFFLRNKIWTRNYSRLTTKTENEEVFTLEKKSDCIKSSSWKSEKQDNCVSQIHDSRMDNILTDSSVTLTSIFNTEKDMIDDNRNQWTSCCFSTTLPKWDWGLRLLIIFQMSNCISTKFQTIIIRKS